jgi:TonB-dependent receptor
MTTLFYARRIVTVFFTFLIAQWATAADELLLYVVDGGNGVAGAEVVVDGKSVGTTRPDGSLTADLGDGSHVVAVTGPTGKTVLARFAAGNGLLANVVANLENSSARVQVFSQTESAADRRDAPTGTVSITVRKGADVAANQLVIFSGGVGAVNTNSQGQATKTLPRGLYTVSVGDVSARVRVVGGIARTAMLRLPEDEGMAIDMPSLEEVFVIASVDAGSIEVSERDTSNIVDTIGVEMLTRFGDSDVAASVVRVPGISVQDDKHVFIRGLGGRYITSTLNNATMPSTNPSKRTVPLDLFPSNFVSQLDIKKTFLPYMPSESTGGNLVINTKTFPDQRGGTVSSSFGHVSGLTGNTVATDSASGGFDIVGWDDGTREEDVVISAISQIMSDGTFVDTEGDTYALTPAIRGELLRTAGILLKDNWDPAFQEATPNASFGVNYGNLFYFDDSELGFYSAFNYSNDWSKRDNGIRRSYSASGNVADDQSYRSYTNNIELSGLLSIGFATGNNTFEWNNLISRSTESFVERSVGQEGDEFETIYQHTSQWEERQYLSSQITGSHFLNEDGSLFGEWQFTASQARRYVPGRTDVRFRTPQTNTDAETLRSNYDFGAANDTQTNVLKGFTFEAGNSSKRWDDLTDNNFDGSFDVTWDVFDAGASFGTIKVGGQAIYRERDAESATYGYFNDGRNPALERAPNVLVSDVIYLCGAGDEAVSCPATAAENGVTLPPVGGVQDNARTGYVFAIRTAVSDEYSAELSYNSAYAMYDHTFDSTWQFIVGARYEIYDQTTDTFDLTTGAPVQGVVDEASLLPSLGVNWFYSDTQQLRFALSQTVARPDFKEASNAVYFDNEFNVRIRGNKDLTISDVLNLDLRWEWYFGENEQDSLSVAAFYKEMSDPIERVVQPASGTAGNTRTFQNSDQAELYGMEIDGRKEFLLTSDYNRTLFVSFNMAYIESEVTAANQLTRALQGQPEYTANLVIGYDDLSAGQQLTLLYNQNGKSIADVGVLGAPDVYLEPRGELNLVFRYDISDSATLKARIENLLDEKVEYTQGDGVFQSYEKGTTLQLGFDWSF